MKKGLKICSLVLALVTLFAVSGCKETQQDSQPSTEEVKVLEKSGYKLVNGGISEYRILLAAVKLTAIRDASRALVSGGGNSRILLEQLVCKLTER